MNLKKYKLEIKKNKKILLTKPIYLLFLPIILLNYVYIRFKKTSITIYLLEMDLSCYSSDGYQYKIFREYKYCKEIIELRIEEESWFDEYKEIVKKRFSNGDYMIVLFNNDTPISYLFVSIDKVKLNPIDLIFKLPKDSIAIYDVYTFKDYRNKGYYKNIFRFTVNYHFNLGYRKSYLWLMKHNQISILSHNNLGMKNVIEEITEVRKYFTRKIFRKKVNYNSLELIEK